MKRRFFIQLILIQFFFANLAWGNEGEVKKNAKQQPAISEKKDGKIQVEPGVLPFLGAVLPGIIYPAGHLVMGDFNGHKKIIAVKGVGLAFLLAGALPLLLTNASPKVIHLPVYSLLTGFGLFSGATLADIYGSIFANNPLGKPQYIPDSYQLKLGYIYLKDYHLGADNLLMAEARINFGKFQIRSTFSRAVPHNTNWLESRFSWRLWGPLEKIKTVSGSFFDLAAGFYYKHFGEEKFTNLGLELLLVLRYDLAGFHQTLRGSFVQYEGGILYHLTGYEALEDEVFSDSELMPLSRLTFGLYMGSGINRGELALYYDHRHDNELAGTSLGSMGDGVIGHFGLKAFYYFTKNWGLGLDLAAGSVYRSLFSISYRGKK
ncbi:MAG: hypothetical protein ACQES9_01760 [Myxococcota bacterium]